MQKLILSVLFLMIILMLPKESPALQVKLYQATMGTVASSTPFQTLNSPTGSLCVTLTGSWGGRVRFDNVGGTARACLINGATTDEARLFNAKITLLQATTIVIEMITESRDNLKAPVVGNYSFAAALKNVAALSSTNLPKTANGILFKVVANSNDINQSGAVSVNCGTTSVGTVAWSVSSTCNKTETESLYISTAGLTISHVSRYELRATAANDFFNFPASGHGIISNITDVEGGRIEVCITLGEDTCIDQYPPVDFKFDFRSPLEGSRGSLNNDIVVNGYLLRATELDFSIPFVCSSILSTPFVEDDSCSIAIAKTTLGQWRDIGELKAVYTLIGGTCPAAFRIMIELDDFRQFFFNICTPTQQPPNVDITDRQGLNNWDLRGIGGTFPDTYSRSVALAGNETVRRIAIGLDPDPNGEDRSVQISELVVDGNSIKAATGVNYKATPANELPLQGFEFRITSATEPSCVIRLTQEEGSVRILGGAGGGKYEAHVAGTSLCGPGQYNIRAHLNENPKPLAGLTTVILQ